jgi:hypothetical protein
MKLVVSFDFGEKYILPIEYESVEKLRADYEAEVMRAAPERQTEVADGLEAFGKSLEILRKSHSSVDLHKVNELYAATPKRDSYIKFLGSQWPVDMFYDIDQQKPRPIQILTLAEWFELNVVNR